MTSQVRVRQRLVPSNGRRIILVANAKGGSGKTTVSTNLSVGYVRMGYAVSLVDCDPQRSSLDWLSARSDRLPPLSGVDGNPSVGSSQLDWMIRIEPDSTRIIVDSKGGLSYVQLQDLLKKVDDVVVPVSPSALDLKATSEFINEVLNSSVFRMLGNTKRLFVVANRMNRRNKYFYQAKSFAKDLCQQGGILIDDSYVFLRCADEGLGVLDLRDTPRYKKERKSIKDLIAHLEATYE